MRRALLLNLAAFSLLFVLHIVFAARGMDLLFSLVAVFISLQVVLFGPLTVVLEGARRRTHRRQTNRLSSLVALPLSFGLAWAYGDMAWSLPAVGMVVGLTVLFHGILGRQLSVVGESEH